MPWSDTTKTPFLFQLLLSFGCNIICMDMSSNGYRWSPACYLLQLVVVMAEISLLQCNQISSAQTIVHASPSRRSITVTTGQWLPTSITTTVFGNSSVRVRFDMADPSLNIDRYRVIINRTAEERPYWQDVKDNRKADEPNAEGVYIGETVFSDLEEGRYSLKVVVKPTNPEVCGVNNCRQTRYQDFNIPVTAPPPTTRLLPNKDITTPARTSRVPTSSVPPPQTQTTRPLLQSVRQHEMDSATWRVAVIAGPVAFVGLLAGAAYCIRSWRKRERAGLAVNIDVMELEEMQNNRRRKGEHDKSLMTAPTLEDHPQLWKRPMKDLSLEEICPASTSTIPTASGIIPPQHQVCDLHDIPTVVPHQWQGLYLNTPGEQLQPTQRPQFPHSVEYPVDHLPRGGYVGVGGACYSCGAAGKVLAPPIWTQGCPHAAPSCVSGAFMEMGGDLGRGAMSEWEDELDNQCGILRSQEELYLGSQSHLDLFKKLMDCPSRLSVASSQFTEMCDYINSSVSTRPSNDGSISQPNYHPRQRLDPLSGGGPMLAPSLKAKLSWRNEVFMRSCPSLPEYP